MTPEIKLYHPPDVDACHASWGATCGPCSLAAALGVPVADVFEAVSDGLPQENIPGLLAPVPARAFRGHMGIKQMRDAIAKLGARVTIVRSSGTIHYGDFWDDIAGHTVLTCVQWDGPWPPRVAAKYRHWVVFRYGYVGEVGPVHVYDWNAKHRAVVRTFDGVSEHVAGSRWSEREEVRGGGWLTLEQWESVLVPRLLPDRSDGTWRIQWAGVVRP